MPPDESSSVIVSRQSAVASAGPDAHRTVVWLRGEHDASTVDELADTMARVLALDDGDLVIDLGEVRFMSAATIGVIVRGARLLALRSRSLALRFPSRCARRLIDVCGLTDLLDPPPVDATRPSGPAGALGTWVAVPRSDRLDRPADRSVRGPAADRDPVLGEVSR